jgi:prolyl-tRNA synthetase
MKNNKEIDWIDLATQAGYLYNAPHIKGGLIYGPEGNIVLNNVNNLIKKYFETEGFNLWSFPNRVAKKDLDILSNSKSLEQESNFNNSVHWIFRDFDSHQKNKTKLKFQEALRPAGESQIYPFWANHINSYKQFDELGKILIQQRFFRTVPKGHRTATKFESDVSEGHALFKTYKEADDAMLKYFLKCQNISEVLCLPSIAIESPIWDNHHFNNRSMYLCSILDDAVRLFGSCYNQSTNLSKKFNIKYRNELNKEETPFIADWGMGAFYPTLWHNRDEEGFILPFKIAPSDIHISQIEDSTEISNYIRSLEFKLIENGYKTKRFLAKNKLGHDRKNWKLKGYPIRIEIGEREFKNKKLSLLQRWDKESQNNPHKISPENIISYLKKCETEFRDYSKRNIDSIKEKRIIFSDKPILIKDLISEGYLVSFNWCGERNCIENMYGKIDEKTKKRDGGLISKGKFLGWDLEDKIENKCISCDKKARRKGYWSRRKNI